LKLAGELGFLPMSLNLNPGYVASHWASVEEGAQRTGRKPRRADWRLVREIFVAGSDAEAWRLSVGSMMGRMMREYFLPLLTDVGVIQFLKHDEAVPDSDVTPEYCARHNWLIGSPATVVEKIERTYDEVGGFGALLLFCFDYGENSEAWHESMRLLAEEVMPKVAHLTPRN
jgi:alkanesulfonate monooxygenase SsuD/methylene tetrahydromethanopterin reductase-like flavin-dependent oxidoreductase (luciferase family)